MTYKKKLIEVAMPLEAINAASKRDKDRKTGTIRNLHKWFAPMPLPAIRALIFASLVDDPADQAERQRLLDLVEELVNSGGARPPDEVIRRAAAVLKSHFEDAPTVLDPFCGGGSTLVEAQRLGLRSVGRDLNPVPVLISKMLAELPPSVYGQAPASGSGDRLGTSWEGLEGLLADIEHYGSWVRDRVFAQIGDRYPRAPNGDHVIAWRWARTVDSPDPRFRGCPTPIVQSWWMSKKPGHEEYILPVVDREAQNIRFEIVSEGEPSSVSGRTCLYSEVPLTFDYIKQQGAEGRLGHQMIAMASDGAHGRTHWSPSVEQERAARVGTDDFDVLNLPLPESALGFTYQLYGYSHWRDLFTDRQRLMLAAFASAVAEVPGKVSADGGTDEQAKAVSTFLGG